VLAQTGSRMISLTEVTAVRRLGVEAANAIVALTPGVAMAIVRRDERGLFVKAVAGLPESLLRLARRARPPGAPRPPDRVADP
jgi:hypothetical protein